MKNVFMKKVIPYVVVAAMIATGLFIYLPTVANEANTPIVALAETSQRLRLDTYSIAGARYYSDAYDVLALVNEERAKEGLSALAMDPELLGAAMLRAAEVNLYFSHTRPSGKSCFSVSVKVSGENIAAGSPAAVGTMQQWMDSPDHRDNILRPDYQSIGIGCFTQGSIKCWVQLFGTGPAVGDASGKANANVTEAVKVSRGNFPFRIKSTKTKLASKKTAEITASIKNRGWGHITTAILPKSFQWKSSDPSVATVSKDGVVTGVGPGAVTITARPSGNPGAKPGAKQRVKLGIIPPKTSVSKLTAGKGRMKVTWQKVSGITKYEVQYRPNGASAWSKKTAPSDASSLTIKNLKKGRAYQVRIRSYKKDSGTKYRSAWSAVETGKRIR
jgi:hypothetical protein